MKIAILRTLLGGEVGLMTTVMMTITIYCANLS